MAVSETEPFPSEAVHVWGLHSSSLRSSRDIAVTEIVGVDDDDVGRTLGGGTPDEGPQKESDGDKCSMWHEETSRLRRTRAAVGTASGHSIQPVPQAALCRPRSP